MSNVLSCLKGKPPLSCLDIIWWTSSAPLGGVTLQVGLEASEAPRVGWLCDTAVFGGLQGQWTVLFPTSEMTSRVNTSGTPVPLQVVRPSSLWWWSLITALLHKAPDLASNCSSYKRAESHHVLSNYLALCKNVNFMLCKHIFCKRPTCL